jgi:LysR substrate binding domain
VVGQNSSEVVEAVRTGELEAGMIALPIDDRGLDVQPIMRDEIVYASVEPAHVRRAMTIEALAEAPLILPDASWGREDPTRRQLAELAQRVGVSIQPQIDVEDIEAALELAVRGLGDTIVARGILLALGSRVPKRLGWVPFDEPIYDTFAFIARSNAPLSPASREFLGLAREHLSALAKALRTEPPRRRAAGGR